ncbi:helix-turn-helix domain-containing protein [Paenibacillus durus]
MGSERLAVLLAIASHMDETGSCYPTQEQIADMLGIRHDGQQANKTATV